MNKNKKKKFHNKGKKGLMFFAFILATLIVVSNCVKDYGQVNTLMGAAKVLPTTDYPEKTEQNLANAFKENKEDVEITSIKNQEGILILDEFDIDVIAGDILSDEAAHTAADDALKKYLASLPEVKGADFQIVNSEKALASATKSEQLILDDLKFNNNKWYAVYNQYHIELPVFDGNIKLIFNSTGELISISDNLRHDLPDEFEFRVGRALAKETSTEVVQWDDNEDEIENIYKGYLNGEPAYKVNLEKGEEAEYEVYVDGVDSEVKGIESDIRTQDSATPEPYIELSATAQPASPEPFIEELIEDIVEEIVENLPGYVYGMVYNLELNEAVLKPLSDLYADDLITDLEGYFGEPKSPYTVGLEGPYVSVRDDDLPPFEATDETLEDGFIWNDENASNEAINAFYYTNEVRNYFADLGYEMNNGIPVSVNSALVDDYMDGCASWFNNTLKTIEIGRAGTGSCPNDLNYALSSDVIYHEYTHFVTEDVTHLPYINGSESAAMSEGLSDYFAASINDDPLWGEFVKPGGERNLDNDLNYATDMTGNAHNDGQIFSGALWDLRESVGADVADTLVFNTLFQDRLHFETFMYGMLIEDDDNADFSDGTPNMAAILEAFSAHGIGPGPEGFDGIVIPEHEAPDEGEEGELYGAWAGTCNWSGGVGTSNLSVPIGGTCTMTGTESNVLNVTVFANGNLILDGDLTATGDVTVYGQLDVGNSVAGSLTINGGDLNVRGSGTPGYGIVNVTTGTSYIDVTAVAPDGILSIGTEVLPAYRGIVNLNSSGTSNVRQLEMVNKLNVDTTLEVGVNHTLNVSNNLLARDIDPVGETEIINRGNLSVNLMSLGSAAPTDLGGDFENFGTFSPAGLTNVLGAASFTNQSTGVFNSPGADINVFEHNGVDGTFTNNGTVVAKDFRIGTGATQGGIVYNRGDMDLTNIWIERDGLFQNNNNVNTDLDLTASVIMIGVAGNQAHFENYDEQCTIAGNLYVSDEGAIRNDGTIDVNPGGGSAVILTGPNTNFDNNGTVNSAQLIVGQNPNEGGTYTNTATGITNITQTGAFNGVGVYGGEIYNNNTTAAPSFRFESQLYLEGISAVNKAIFQNSGVVDAGEESLTMANYSLLDLNGGRYVMNEEGCGASPPNAGYINMRSLTGNADDVMIDIAPGASMSAGLFEIGWQGDGSSAKVINNGTIQKLDVAGNPLDCPVDIRLVEDSEFENKAGALIDLYDNRISLADNTVFTNENTASITGDTNSEITLHGDNAVFNQDGEIDVNSLLITGDSGPSALAFNASGTSSTTVTGLQVGNESLNVGGNATFANDSDLIVNGQFAVLGYGDVTLNTNEVSVDLFTVQGGDTDGGSTLRLTDPAPGNYDIGVLTALSAQAGYTNLIQIDPGVVVDLTQSIEFPPASGDFYSGGVGFSGFAGGGTNLLTLNGTINIANDPVNATIYIVGDDGQLDIGPDGFLNIDDADGEFRTLDGTNVNDISTDPGTEGVDVEGSCEIAGNYDLNNRLDCGVDLGIKDNGVINIDPSSEINIGNDLILSNLTTTFDNPIVLDLGHLLQMDNSQFDNNGTLNFGTTTDLSGITNSIFNNYGDLDIDSAEFIVRTGSTLFNDTTGVITGHPNDGELRVFDDSAIFINDGDIDTGVIEVRGTTSAGGTFTTSAGTTVNVEFFAVGNQSSNLGGNATIDAGAQVNVSNSAVVEGHGVLIADGQIDAPAGGLLALAGQATGGGKVFLNDISDDYDFGIMFMNTPLDNAYTTEINIADGVTLNILDAVDIGGGTYIQAGMGGDPDDNPGTIQNGDSVLTINGTLNIADYPAQPTSFEQDVENNKIIIGPNGLLNYGDEDGTFTLNSQTGTGINGPYGLFDNSDGPGEGFVSQSECIFDWNVTSENRIECDDLIHVQDDGNVDIGLDSVVTAVGSETIVDGFIELDGLWNAGNLTVNGPAGHISSGDDPTYDETNFLIVAEDVVVNAGGRISSDGVSSRGVHANGPGSYGGEGEGRGTGSIYGPAKMDSTSSALYGESGMNGGVPEANGGGAVRIFSTGSIAIDGEVSANGTNSTVIGGSGGAGGTVIIEHQPSAADDVFTGVGNIFANGNGSDTDATALSAGGGRIAIISPLFEYTDFPSYDFSGNIEAGPGSNTAAGPNTHAATGTIYFGGDNNNPNGTLLVHQLNRTDAVAETTYIPNIGDIDFDKIEVLGGGVVDYQADPAPPTVCYETDGTITFPTLTCGDYDNPDKPRTLYINTTDNGAQGADPTQEPGYQVADGVSDTPLVVEDLTPEFSFVYDNPVNPSQINQMRIQVDDSDDFSSPLWDQIVTNVNVTPGDRTRDIHYGEGGATALSEGVDYYVRAQFINAPGLWSHADYNKQWKFTVLNPPAAAPQGGGGAGGRSGNYIPPGSQPPAEEPPAEEPPAEEPPVEEPPAEEPPAEQPPVEEPPVEEPPAEEPPAEQPPVTPPSIGVIELGEPPTEPEEEPPAQPQPKVPVKKTTEEDQFFEGEKVIPGCTRADVTERILNEFDLFNLFALKDQKCLANWENCMLPFLLHSSYDVNEDFYYPDVQKPSEGLEDINFATRNRMVQGYYLEEDSPFKPLRNMSRIEILKLLNFVIGQEWLYEEEFFAQIGGVENLANLFVNASDIEEWWHIRYHNYACELGIIECDPFAEFKPNAVCSVDWIDNIINKYKRYFNDENIAAKFNLDSDNDTISDKDEDYIFGTDANKSDTDDDQIDDAKELYEYKTNPNLSDTDGDNLDDGEEISVYKTNPLKSDTDDDGAPDNIEIDFGTDPNDPQSFPEDLNGNGIADSWEEQFGLAPNNGTDDEDGDGLADILEYRYGTNPLEADTDGDGLTDGAEVLIYGSDPLEFTDLADLGVLITNLKDGMILTDYRPLIQGIAPKEGMEILILLKNEFGHEIQLGNTVVDDQNVFEFIPEFDLRDGEFYLIAKGMDPENQLVLTSKPVRVTLDSSVDIEEPVPERLSNITISEDVLLEDLTIEISDKKPVLHGRTGFNNKVTAVWHSVVGASSIIADISGGQFSIEAPTELPFGSHYVTAYALRETDQAMSKVININFDIKEGVAKVLHDVNGKDKGVNWPLWIAIILGGIVVVGGGAWWLKRKLAAKTAAGTAATAATPDTPKAESKPVDKNMMSD